MCAARVRIPVATRSARPVASPRPAGARLAARRAAPAECSAGLETWRLRGLGGGTAACAGTLLCAAAVDSCCVVATPSQGVPGADTGRYTRHIPRSTALLHRTRLLQQCNNRHQPTSPAGGPAGQPPKRAPASPAPRACCFLLPVPAAGTRRPPGSPLPPRQHRPLPHLPCHTASPSSLPSPTPSPPLQHPTTRSLHVRSPP